MHLVKELSKAKPPPEDAKELLIILIASIFALPPTDALQCQNGETVDVEALYSQNMEALEAMLRSLLIERPYSTELLVLLDVSNCTCIGPKDSLLMQAKNPRTFLFSFPEGRAGETYA
ncbi:maestro heat-like repeat-containing protein family member 7 [Eublepharis macularius]|uniref:Maestro heat-like repeat-containing protein family member 7 n=1 Tax=Eublepharis macularius TaxID=481883 RepID=A0AA97JDZ1_EUBMA|nr:maestro heat-like repeat-containing protein family member 7 [Eublepharis macularius]